VGRIISAVNPDILAQFEYDDAGRLSEKFKARMGAHGIQHRRRSDPHADEPRPSSPLRTRPNGRVRKLHTGNNHSLAFERDARGRETGRQMPGSVRIEQRSIPWAGYWNSGGRALSAPGREPTLAQESRIPAARSDQAGLRYDADGLLLSSRTTDGAQLITRMIRQSGS